jgi:hypothetical protein
MFRRFSNSLFMRWRGRQKTPRHKTTSDFFAAMNAAHHRDAIRAIHARTPTFKTASCIGRLIRMTFFSRWTWPGWRRMICRHEFFARLGARLSFQLVKMDPLLPVRFCGCGFGGGIGGAEYSNHQFFQFD